MNFKGAQLKEATELVTNFMFKKLVLKYTYVCLCMYLCIKFAPLSKSLELMPVKPLTTGQMEKILANSVAMSVFNNVPCN